MAVGNDTQVTRRYIVLVRIVCVREVVVVADSKAAARLKARLAEWEPSSSEEQRHLITVVGKVYEDTIDSEDWFDDPED